MSNVTYGPPIWIEDCRSPAKAQSEVERLTVTRGSRVDPLEEASAWCRLISEVAAQKAEWFAALPSEEQIRADERERCAKVAEEYLTNSLVYAHTIAAAIRLGPREQDKPT